MATRGTATARRAAAPPLPEDLPSLARLFAEGRTLFLDIGPLREPQFTGIPNVAANLARAALEAGLPCRFFIGENLIRPEHVRFLLESGGGFFGYHHQLGQTAAGPLLAEVRRAPRPVGLFPAEKPFHRLFDVELQVVHDFSTIATPHFHLDATRARHGASLLDDIASNDLTICVSAATAGYLRRLCPEAAGRVAVAPNGVRWPERFAAMAEALYGRLDFEPFVLILGTLEPRKNLEVVFRALAEDRGLLGRYRWIFTGREGWLFDFAGTAARHLGAVPENVTHAGFVDEFRKYALLRFARFTIYPSLFEGFGLPILESLSLGTPPVHSASSSMAEVAGEAGFPFRPESPAELLGAIYRLEAALAEDAAALRRRCLDRAAGFTWQGMLATILRETLLLERGRA
ncbi:glycosyltransferase family 4 protein [Crenalkalicoccus roseus]|uniref:glycosyltransferase family 4 protein n=1 Tax=Crenalkalicoccus roseus TaxID=1485588 RepID=UPI00108019A4|nr:glycosyltransferase family 1 protein [Crenalkalicoccus roseus]